MKIKHSLTTFGLSILIYTLTSACGVDNSGHQLNIYGGDQVAQGDWPSAIGIGDQDRLFCSGTVVHPRIVITAAHCVEGLKKAKNLRVYVGGGKEGGKLKGQYKVSDFAYSRKYSDSRIGRKKDKGKDKDKIEDEESWYDVAYLLMKDSIDIPASQIPKILVDKGETSQIISTGKLVRLVGFGQRDDNGSGIKFEVDAPIRKIYDTEIFIGSKGKDSCYGDSGGPAYGQLENGEWRVFGVVSRGEKCGVGGIWGRMSAHVCWIQESSGIQLVSGYC